MKKKREKIKIAYLGPEGTFTQQAMFKKFGKKEKYIKCKTIDEVFKKVEEKKAEYGVIPIENSIEGIVNNTLDLFIKNNLKITSEIPLKINQSILSNEKKN